MTVTPMRSLAGMREGSGAAAWIRVSLFRLFSTTDLELEAVHADGDGTDHTRVELLVVRIAVRRSDVDELPLEV